MAKGNRTNPQARPESSDQRRNGQRTPRPEKIDYPGLKSAAGEDVRLTAIPTDFNPKEHKPLSKKNFADEAVFYDMRATEFERKAKRMRRLSEDAKRLGGVADRAQAKKLQTMQRRFDELKASLAAQGVDVSAILAATAPSTNGDDEESETGAELAGAGAGAR